MARIETYPFDTAITPNDYVIGTDADSLNATKNYKMSTMLGYLGNMFNLQSQDLYYSYNNVASGSVDSGEISSNNYADGTILMSGVTNLYVSKLTALNALVDTYLNAIATDGLTVIVMDLSAPENYAVCVLTGSSDVDANTIDLAVTVAESNGELVAGRSIGLKLTTTAGGSAPVDSVFGRTGAVVALSSDYSAHYGGLFGANTWNGVNTFQSRIEAEDGMTLEVAGSVTSKSGAGTFTLLSGNRYVFKQSDTNDNLILDIDSISTSRTLTAPDASGTIALTSDITGFVDLTTNQNVDGQKTFLDEIILNDVVKMKASSTASTGGVGSGIFRYVGSSLYAFHKDNSFIIGEFDLSSITANRTYTLQDSTGTLAHLTDIPTISNTAYNATSWNGNLDGASKNSIRDKIETLEASIPTVPDLASQAEAEAGTENTKIMTALRTQQAIDAYSDSGTFTPAVVANGTAGYTYTTQSGDYRKVGDIVHFDLLLVVSATSGTPSSGDFKISGLPFAKSNSRITPVNVYSTAGIAITSAQTFTAIIPSDDYIWITYRLTNDATPYSVKNDDLSSAFTIYVSGTYTTNS